MRSEIKKNESDFSKDSILELFQSFKSLDEIQKFIEEGEVENEYLECKQSDSAHLGSGLKKQLARTMSAFANNKGGIILIGVQTDKAGEVDRLTQIVPIGSVKKLAKEIKTILPLVCEPPVRFVVKTIKEKESDKKGIVGIYIYPTSSDPVRATTEKKFYLRIGGNDQPMPYETIKRMFLGAESPDVWKRLDPRLVKIKEGKWEIPIELKNFSTAIAKNTTVTIRINNPSSCEKIEFQGFKDQSDINPGSKIYMTRVLREPIYKGLNSLIGTMFVTMKKRKIKLDILVTIYSENMRARYQKIKIYLYKRKFRIKELERDYLY